MPGSIMGGGGFVGGMNLPQELQTVLEKLREMFGPNLHFFPDDKGYLNFHVWNLTDDVLFHELERNQDQLFGQDLHKFQILRPYGRSNDRGVFLRFLEPELRGEFKTGFSHY